MSDISNVPSNNTSSNNNDAIQDYQKFSKEMFNDQLAVARVEAQQAVHQTVAKAVGQSGR